MFIGKYKTINHIDVQQSFGIVGGICHTTYSIRHVVVFLPILYDTTRLYAIVVLQVSNLNGPLVTSLQIMRNIGLNQCFKKYKGWKPIEKYYLKTQIDFRGFGVQRPRVSSP